MLKDIRFLYDEPISIFYDNSSAFKISKNLLLHSKTKNISIKFHFLREKVNEKEARLEYVSTKEQIANIFTNPLPKDTFKYLRGKLRVIAPPD
jgi:precorrin-6x reductase